MKRIFTLFLFLILFVSGTFHANAIMEEFNGLSALLDETYNSALYTSESYYAYQSSLNYALQIFEREDVTPGQIEDAYLKLLSAKEGLTLMPERKTLSSYSENLEKYIHDSYLDLSDEIVQSLIAARDEFLFLSTKIPLTQEELSFADERYNSLISEVEKAGKMDEFSSEKIPEGVIIPKDVPLSSANSARTANIRLIFILVGSLLAIIGGVAAILYFKPPKFLQ